MMHDAVAEHSGKHLALLGIGNDESTSMAVPCIVGSSGHHRVHSDSRPDLLRISRRMTSCAYGGLHRNKPRRDRAATAVVSGDNRKSWWFVLSCCDVNLMKDCETKPSDFHHVCLMSVDECCTALRVNPLNRLLLF